MRWLLLRGKRLLLLTSIVKFGSADKDVFDAPGRTHLRQLSWYDRNKERSNDADNAIRLIESVPCEPDHMSAVEFVSQFARADAGNEDCASEADPESCARGCCRFGDYFLCDTTNSYTELPCVCGRNTYNHFMGYMRKAIPKEHWHTKETKHLQRDGEDVSEALFLSGWGGQSPDDPDHPNKEKSKEDEESNGVGVKTIQVQGYDAWQTQVINNPSVTMVAFTAPWCPSCQALHPEYDAAAARLDGKARLVWVDATDGTNSNFIEPYSVQGYPKMFIFPAGAPKYSSHAEWYQGAHTASDIVNAVLHKVEDSGQTLVGPSSTEETKEGPAPPVGGTTVLPVLGQDAWDAQVINNPLVTMVAFTAPWCPSCQALHPEFDAAAAQLGGMGAQLVWVDATDGTNSNIVAQYDVQGYPKIVIFPAGAPKDRSQAEWYKGAHTASDIVNAVLHKVDDSGKPIAGPSSTEETKEGTVPPVGGKTALPVLGQEAWDAQVINNPLVTMVAFTAPWCPACQALHPEYDAAAAQLGGMGAQLVWVDATDGNNSNIVAQYNVQGYPKIVIFPAGAPKDSSQAKWYQGPYSALDIANAVLEEIGVSSTSYRDGVIGV